MIFITLTLSYWRNHALKFQAFGAIRLWHSALYSQIVRFRDILQTPENKIVTKINPKFPIVGTVIGLITATVGGIGYYFIDKKEKNEN